MQDPEIAICRASATKTVIRKMELIATDFPARFLNWRILEF
jgi:hypothetical protein